MSTFWHRWNGKPGRQLATDGLADDRCVCGDRWAMGDGCPTGWLEAGPIRGLVLRARLRLEARHG